MFSINGNKLVSFNYRKQAVVGLGIPQTTLLRFTNLVNYTVYSPIMEMDVYIIDPTQPLSYEPPVYSNTDHIGEVTGVDLYSITYGKLVALMIDKVTVYGEYDSPGDAAQTLDNKSDNKYIRRYINLERVVRVGLHKIPVYMANLLAR